MTEILHPVTGNRMFPSSPDSPVKRDLCVKNPVHLSTFPLSSRSKRRVPDTYETPLQIYLVVKSEGSRQMIHLRPKTRVDGGERRAVPPP